MMMHITFQQVRLPCILHGNFDEAQTWCLGESRTLVYLPMTSKESIAQVENRMRNSTIALIATLFFFAASPANAADAKKGAATYAQLCAMCHGEKGAGDGALAATFPEAQKPRNLTAGNNKYATDDTKLKELIKKGGAAVGLSVLMPAQAGLNDEQLGDLVAFLNSLKK